MRAIFITQPEAGLFAEQTKKRKGLCPEVYLVRVNFKVKPASWVDVG